MQNAPSTPQATVPVRSLIFMVLALMTLMAGLVVVDLYLPTKLEAKPMPLIVARGISVSQMQKVMEKNLPEPKGSIKVDEDGFVVSKNPVWNMCIRNVPLPVGFLRQNADAVMHRQGRVRKRIPLSCRDYHRSGNAVWQHPDFDDLEVYVSREGKLLGLLQSGYVIEKMQKNS